MGVLEDTYNELVNIYKTTTTSSTGSDSLILVAENVRCIIRPVTDKTQLFNIAHQGKEYKMWCNYDFTVRANYLVLRQLDSKYYGVAGTNEHEDLEDDSESHLEVIIYQK